MLTSTRLATLFVVALALLCSWSPRAAGQGNSYSVSSYHHESFGPDGIVMGRSGYKDSSGKSRFTHYHVGKDGRRKFIRDDPEGDLEARSLLPDPSKIGFPGFPGLGDPHLDFFRALGFPKGSLFPSFPQDLLPHDLLPPSVASGNGKGVEGRKGTSSNFPNFPATTPDFFSGSLLPPIFTQDFFPADLLPKDLLPPNVGTPATSGGAKDKPVAAAPAATTPTIPPTAIPQGKRIPPPPVPRTEAEPYRFQ